MPESQMTLGQRAKILAETNALYAGILETVVEVHSFFQILPFIEGNNDYLTTFNYRHSAVNAELATIDLQAHRIRSSTQEVARGYLQHITDYFVKRPLKMRGPLGVDLIGAALQWLSPGKKFLMMNAKTMSQFLHRYQEHKIKVVGPCLMECYQLPNGQKISAFEDVPIFSNNRIEKNKIVAGKLDDGTETQGMVGRFGIPHGTAGFYLESLEPVHLSWTAGISVTSLSDPVVLVNADV